MALNTSINKTSDAGNGSTTVFNFPYLFFADNDLVVTLVVNSTGVETTQTITTHYTVAGAGNTAGGTVTMVTAPASGETLVIQRIEQFTQGLDLVENDAAPSGNQEKQYDIVTMLAQQLNEGLTRAVKLPVSNTGDGTLGPLTANYILTINSSADGVTLLNPSTLDTSVAYTNLVVDTFNGDGSTVSFTLSSDPAMEANTQVFVESVYQAKSTYSLSGTTLTFETAPLAGTANIEVVHGTTVATTGVLLISNNLSDVADAATAATNLGLGTADSAIFSSLQLTSNVPRITFTESDATANNAKWDIDVNSETFTIRLLTDGGAAGNIMSVSRTGQTIDGIVLSGPVTVPTLDTGQGANELYAMNQDVETTDNVTFADLIVSAGGGAVIGHTGHINVQGGTPETQLLGTSALTSASSVLAAFVASASGPTMMLMKSRNGTIGSNTIVQDNDILGSVNFIGDDGASFASIGATFFARVQGTPGTNDMPAELVWGTTADGNNSPTERMTLSRDGALALLSAGMDIPASSNYSVAGTNILSDSSGTMTLSNIDAIDATTETTLEAAIDALSNLVTVGALDAGSITSGFGNIDIGSSTIDTTGAVATGALTGSGLALFNKSSSSLVAVGQELNASGQIFATADGTSIVHINRKTSDGQLIVFYKDTAGVGDITVSSGTVTLTAWSAGHYALWKTPPAVEPPVGTIISVTDTLSEWLIHYRYDKDGNKELVQGHGTNRALGDTWVEEIPAETKTVTKQKTVKEVKTEIAVEEIDGRMQQVEKTVEIDAPAFEDVPLFGTDGEPVMVEVEPEVMKQATHKKPVMADPVEVEVKPAETWTHKIERFDHERLLTIEVSNKKKDVAVYGTYAGTDPETGNILVFAAGLAGGPGVRVTGPSNVGDLLVSNGDGTAVVDNKATMSNCIGKVLRGNPSAGATDENLTISVLYCG